MSHELQLFLVLAIIIVVSKLAGHISRKFDQPVVFGEILAGLLFGPTLLNMFGWPVFANSSGWLQEQVHTLAGIGVLLLMFIAGLETDLAQMRKVGKIAFWAAVFGVVLPLGLGALTSRLFGIAWNEAIFIGTVLTATSVSISAQTLMELGRLRSKEGMTILGAAVIDDILGIIVLSFVVAFETAHAADSATGHAAQGIPALCGRLLGDLLGQPHWAQGFQIATILLLMATFFAVAMLLGSRWLGRVLDVASRLHASHAVPAAALLLVFLFAVGSEYIGQVAAITGAYLVGIFIGQTRHHQEVTDAIHPFTYALFVPIFFMSIGLSTDTHVLTRENLLFTGAIVLVAVVTKVVGCGLGARLTGFSMPEAVRVGVGMISRGEVGLIVASVGKAAGIIETPVYAAMIIMVLVSTIVTPVLLRLTFKRAPEEEGDVFESVVATEIPNPVDQAEPNS